MRYALPHAHKSLGNMTTYDRIKDLVEAYEPYPSPSMITVLACFVREERWKTLLHVIDLMDGERGGRIKSDSGPLFDEGWARRHESLLEAIKKEIKTL